MMENVNKSQLENFKLKREISRIKNENNNLIQKKSKIDKLFDKEQSYESLKIESSNNSIFKSEDKIEIKNEDSNNSIFKNEDQVEIKNEYFFGEAKMSKVITEEGTELKGYTMFEGDIIPDKRSTNRMVIKYPSSEEVSLYYPSDEL